MECREIITDWLNNAYAMELAIAETLERHAKDAEEENEMEMAEKLKKHVKETRDQAALVETRINELGGKPSSGKSFLAKIMGAIQGTAAEWTEDKIVKNAIMEYATEYFERATYKSIAIAAERCNDEKTAAICNTILKEETSTGEMLDKDLEKIVRDYLEDVLTR